MLLQTQDAGGPRGRFNFNASGHRQSRPTPRRRTGVANSFASFLLDWPNAVQRDLKVIDQPGTQALGDVRVRPGQVAGALERHRRPRAALGVLHAARRASKARAASSNYDPATNTLRVAGLRRHRQRAEREEELHELRAAHRRVLAPQREDRRPRRLRRQHDSVPGQPLRVQLPGEAELRRVGRRTASSAPARWPPGFPPPALLDIPSNGIIPVSGSAAERDLRRDPERPARRHAALLERRLPAPAAVPAHGRCRLRRQPRRRPRDGRRHQREHGLRIGQQRPAAVRARSTAPARSRTRTNDNKSQYNALQMKVDRRFRNGLLRDQLVHARAGRWTTSNENSGIGTPIDFEQSWARSNFDRTHNYALDRRSTSCRGARTRSG